MFLCFYSKIHDCNNYDNQQSRPNKLSHRWRRDDMPPPTAVRLAADLRARSPHLAKLQPIVKGWDRQTDGSRYRLMPPPYGGRHNKITITAITTITDVALLHSHNAITNHFGDPGRAIGQMCVCVCVRADNNFRTK